MAHRLTFPTCLMSFTSLGHHSGQVKDQFLPHGPGIVDEIDHCISVVSCMPSRKPYCNARSKKDDKVTIPKLQQLLIGAKSVLYTLYMNLLVCKLFEVKHSCRVFGIVQL